MSRLHTPSFLYFFGFLRIADIAKVLMGNEKTGPWSIFLTHDHIPVNEILLEGLAVISQ